MPRAAATVSASCRARIVGGFVGALMPTASRAACWDSTISTYVGQSASSSACVPMPTTRPSSSTTIWSASAMVDTRWATITTVASAVTGFSAARSRASVARSSAENESSNR